ncbi:hypothetical protein P4536_28480 [Bacillus thuringiensis]|nr:hypothetical protein [Bacillus thuringiensis]
MTPALLDGLGAVAEGFGALSTTTMMQVWEKTGDLEDALFDVDAAMINNDALKVTQKPWLKYKLFGTL